MNFGKRLRRKSLDPVEELICYLTLLEGVTKILEDNILSSKIWDKISKAIDRLHLSMKRSYNKSQLKMDKLISTFKLTNEKEDILAIISFTMLLYEDIEKKFDDIFLRELNALVFELQKSYDPNLDMHDIYQRAEEMYKYWNRI